MSSKVVTSTHQIMREFDTFIEMVEALIHPDDPYPFDGIVNAILFRGSPVRNDDMATRFALTQNLAAASFFNLNGELDHRALGTSFEVQVTSTHRIHWTQRVNDQDKLIWACTIWATPMIVKEMTWARKHKWKTDRKIA